MRIDRSRFADARHVFLRVHGSEALKRHATAFNSDNARLHVYKFPGKTVKHRFCPFYTLCTLCPNRRRYLKNCRSAVPEAWQWQMAMASASAVSSGFGTSRRHKRRRVISITCGFKALPYPVTGQFHLHGGVFKNRHAGLLRRKQNDATASATPMPVVLLFEK